MNMPGFDRRGPFGDGPRTGRGLGGCRRSAGRGTAASGEILRGVGRGGSPWGGGRGRCFGGRGMGWQSFPVTGPLSTPPTEEADTLKARLASAESEVAAIKARLEELEKKR